MDEAEAEFNAGFEPAEPQIISCALTLRIGDKQTLLECTCPPGSETRAANALMIEMHERIRAARSRSLAVQPSEATQ